MNTVHTWAGTCYEPPVIPPGPNGDVFSRRATEEAQRTELDQSNSWRWWTWTRWTLTWSQPPALSSRWETGRHCVFPSSPTPQKVELPRRTRPPLPPGRWTSPGWGGLWNLLLPRRGTSATGWPGGGAKRVCGCMTEDRHEQWWKKYSDLLHNLRYLSTCLSKSTYSKYLCGSKMSPVTDIFYCLTLLTLTHQCLKQHFTAVADRGGVNFFTPVTNISLGPLQRVKR